MGIITKPSIKIESYPVKTVDLIMWHLYYTTIFEICKYI